MLHTTKEKERCRYLDLFPFLPFLSSSISFFCVLFFFHSFLKKIVWKCVFDLIWSVMLWEKNFCLIFPKKVSKNQWISILVEQQKTNNCPFLLPLLPFPIPNSFTIIVVPFLKRNYENVPKHHVFRSIMPII